jgi:hypothetical protein
MLTIDDWRIMYEGQEQDMAKLRASLHDLEKRHEEAKLSLEVALRARVGELAGERYMWRIRCESPEATPVRVFEGEA